MTAAGPQPGQPVVFRNATVLTMDDAHTVLTGADVLVDGERIAAAGTGPRCPRAPRR
jgi:5-methylthioadenosine/S-adenosylhomocysteine deaminase